MPKFNRFMSFLIIGVSLSISVSTHVLAQKPQPFFATRGIVLSWEDVQTPQKLNWIALAKEAGITTLSIFADETRIGSKKYQDFIAQCNLDGIDIEYQDHAMAQLLPRNLFEGHPEYFRMNEAGERTNDFNCCPSSEEALKVIAANAKIRAKKYIPSNNRYYYWLDDGGKRCYCDKCKKFNDSDQALIIENRIIKALKEINPKAMLAHLAYQNTLDAPSIIKPEQGIFLEFAPFFRRWDKPLKQRDAIRGGMRITHGEYMDALRANLEIFPVKTAQVLEYWMDVSLFSDWKKPAQRLPWNKDVFLLDIETYARLGIRHVTAYAVYVDAVYYESFKDISFVKEYGFGLKNYQPDK